MLHGEIKLNGYVLGEWKAVRRDEYLPERRESPGPFFEYECWVEYRDMGGYLNRAHFVLGHRYGDGAMRLASRVIARGYDRAKRVNETLDPSTESFFGRAEHRVIFRSD